MPASSAGSPASARPPPQSGISEATFDRAFRDVTDPDPEVLEKARTQAEFKAPAWDYFDNRVQEQSIANGRAMARKWKPWLDRIEKRFGVDRNILLAIWSMESNYGEILKDKKVMRNVVRSLATLAYADKRRAKFARTQLIAALKILQTGDIDESHLTGSWAGAMGHTQFIPTSYQAYAVDMDGDGRRDIWNSVPDALATAANLLRKNGWQAGKTWGYEVALPDGKKFPSGSMSLVQMAGHRRDARQRQAVQERRRQRRAQAAGRPRRAGLPDDQEFPRHQGLQQCRQIRAGRRPSCRRDRRLWRAGQRLEAGPSPSFRSTRSRSCRSG